MAFKVGKVKSFNNFFRHIIFILITAGWLWSGNVIAQHEPYANPVWKIKPRSDFDSSSLWHAFKDGLLSGHIRQFSMATINQHQAPDYYALAIGAGIRYQTAPFHGFQVTLSGYFIQNVASTNLTATDAATGAVNRYEIGLFDIEHPENKANLDRLEELNISYVHKGLTVTYGKQIVKTAFINPQDGRMRPTEVSGLWTVWQPNQKQLTLEAGWLNRIAPRSTFRWYDVDETMGIYPSGVQTNGQRSDYHHNLNSKGILYTSAAWNASKWLTVQANNHLVENIFQTTQLQADVEWKKKTISWLAAAQFTFQSAVNNGGNADVSKTYFVPGQNVGAFSARLGIKKGRLQSSLNFTRIGKGGRFLMPREWGREPFFTFLQRERNEGLGDVTAWMLKNTYKLPKVRTVLDAGIGLYQLPHPTDYLHNKYGMPSYGQLNLSVQHEFNGFLKGLYGELLYAYKWNRLSNNSNTKWIINKVNMTNLNLMLNYHF
jgi:hypothetical protein